MAMRWPLLGLLLLVLLPAAYWLLGKVRPAQEPPAGLPVAHAARLRALPRFRERARQQVAWATFQLVAVGLVLLGSVWLAARPVHTEVVDRPARQGDLILCLDLTPQQRVGDVEVLAQTRTLLPRLTELKGTRLGVHGYQTTTAELLPLTDDLGQADMILADVQKALGDVSGEATSGATGDGLVSCAKALDGEDKRRGRAVVLVTAADPSSSSLYPLVEAAQYAASHSVAVYAIPAGAGKAAQADLKTAAELTGGALVTGPGPIGQVWDLERNRLDPPPSPVRRDAPLVPTVLVLLGVGGLVLAGLRGLFR